MLATKLTPSAYRITEVFAAGTQPTKRSDVWNAPAQARSFTVTHNDDGLPVLVIGASDDAVYRVQRDAVGESFILTELYGSAGETLYFTDTKAQPGVVYTYRVIPVHAELLQNGILLEGMQSVQVAKVKTQSLGGALSGWWTSLFGRRNGGEADSIFSD